MVISRKRLRASFHRVKEDDEEPALRPRRPLWEYVLLLFFVGLALYAIIFVGYQQTRHYREMMLRQQLWQIRSAILIYYTLHDALPPDLKSLVMSQISDPRAGVFFPLLEGVRVDDAGRTIDPLGYPYAYDASEGRVKSVAPCCSDW